MKLAASAGLHLDPWQQAVVRGGFAEKADRTFAASEVTLLCPRQNGKGSILEAVELAYLFLFGARLVIHSAHLFSTSKMAFRRTRELVEGTPFLAQQVQQWRQSNDDVSLELKNGAFLRWSTRTPGAMRGFTADYLIFDEAYNMNQDAMSAIMPTTMTRANSQTWYTSTAGNESSEVLAGLRDRGRRGGEAMAYFEWSAPDDADLDDRQAWAQANPSLGLRISPTSIATMRGALDDESFAREQLGIWHDPGTVSAIDADVWAKATDKQSAPVDPVAFAVDVSQDRLWASVGVAGYRPDGLLHVEVPESRPGTDWVVPRVAEMVSRSGPCAVLVDVSGPAGSLVPDLERAGVKVTTSSPRQMGQACGVLFDAVKAGKLRHLGGVALNTALGSARKRVKGDAWVWDRKDTVSDITPLVAVTLAVWGLVSTLPAPSVYESRPMVTV